MLLFFMCQPPNAGLMRPAFHKGADGKSAYKNKEQKEEEKTEWGRGVSCKPQMPLKNEAEVLMKM